MWDSSEIWYSVFKLASIIFGGIVAALGEFFGYKNNGKITKTGKVALLLFSLSVISAVVFSFLEDKKAKANDATQEAHYKSNIDTLKLVADKLNTIEKQYKENADIEAERHRTNLNKLLVVNSNLRNIITNLQAQNDSNYRRHLQSLDSLSRVTKELFTINNKAIDIVSSTENLNKATKEILRDLEKAYFPIDPLQLGFSISFNIKRENLTALNKKNKSFHVSDLNTNDTIEFNKHWFYPNKLMEPKISDKARRDLYDIKEYLFQKTSPKPLIASSVSVEIEVVNDKYSIDPDILYKGETDESTDLERIILTGSSVKQVYKKINFSSKVYTTRIKNLNDLKNSTLKFSISFQIDDPLNCLEIKNFSDLQVSFGTSPKYRLEIDDKKLKGYSVNKDRLKERKPSIYFINIWFEVILDGEMFEKFSTYSILDRYNIDD